jgi:hypothetical protein
MPRTGSHAKANTQASVATGERRSKMIQADSPITQTASPKASHDVTVIDQAVPFHPATEPIRPHNATILPSRHLA